MEFPTCLIEKMFMKVDPNTLHNLNSDSMKLNILWKVKILTGGALSLKYFDK